MSFINYESPGYSISNLVDELLAFDTYSARDRQVAMTSFPRVDIVEENDRYMIFADMPGLDKSDIAIEVKDSVLSMSGEKKEEKSERSKERYYHFERSYGTFHREFSLPDHVDDEHIEATLTNGVLTLILKKTEESEPAPIEIKVL